MTTKYTYLVGLSIDNKYTTRVTIERKHPILTSFDVEICEDVARSEHGIKSEKEVAATSITLLRSTKLLGSRQPKQRRSRMLTPRRQNRARARVWAISHKDEVLF